MKFKEAYYCNNGIVNPKYTKDDWVRHKDKYYRWSASAEFQDAFGIKLKSKHRHSRSITRRDLKRLYKRTLYELDWSKRSFQEMNFWTPYTMDCNWIKKHRIYI